MMKTIDPKDTMKPKAPSGTRPKHDTAELLRNRVTTDTLPSKGFDSEVAVAGYISRIKKVSSALAFVVLADQYGEVQLTCKSENLSNMGMIGSLTRHTFVVAEGTLIKGQAKAGREIVANELRLLTDKPAQPLPIEVEHVNTGLEKRLDYRWIDLRHPKHRIPLILLSKASEHFRDFLEKERFVEIFTPKFTSQPTEGGAEVFPVEYFGRKAYLAQSPQFYKQMAICSGLERVFEIAPVFRANPSFTSRHDTEFTSFDFEFAYISSHHDVMAMEERMLNHAIKGIVGDSAEDIAQLTKTPLEPPGRIPKIKMEEAHKVAGKANVTPEGDLTAEGEKKVAAHVKKETGNDFVFVIDYPLSVRPFYHMLGEPMSNGAPTTKSFDLLFRGVEITTGAQREHNYDRLLENVKTKGLNQKFLQYYLDFFRYGAPPHGGLGFGMTRVVTQLLDLGNVRESTLLPRDPGRLTP